jgi:hypothetical protein
MFESHGDNYRALDEIRRSTPFLWKELPSQNGSEGIKRILYEHCRMSGFDLPRHD